MLLSGPNGIGKSALARRWMATLDSRLFAPLLLTQATLSGSSLLSALKEHRLLVIDQSDSDDARQMTRSGSFWPRGRPKARRFASYLLSQIDGVPGVATLAGFTNPVFPRFHAPSPGDDSAPCNQHFGARLRTCTGSCKKGRSLTKVW